MQVKIIHHFLFQFFCLLSISFFSTYRIPDMSEINWDSALFLTPAGMIKNFTAPSPVMRSFYGDISAGQVQLATWQLFAIFLILLIQIFNFHKLLKLIKK